MDTNYFSNNAMVIPSTLNLNEMESLPHRQALEETRALMVVSILGISFFFFFFPLSLLFYFD